MTTALILAGHGSHISPETAGLVWRHVDALRAMGAADEVTAAFWKEMPSFHQVLSTLEADDVTIVPLFTAQGYFTQTVIPAEFGLDGALTRRGGRIIRYARTLNEHPYLTEVVRKRVREGFSALGTPPDQTAVAILGHSTRRNPESRRATEAQAEQMRAANVAAEVVAAYLDDTPSISDIYSLTSAPALIAVPYFLASGSHTTMDVPRALLLDPGQQQAIINGRTLYYTDPVGAEEALRDVILELAKEAGAPIETRGDGSAWDCFPSAGRGALVAAVQAAGTLRFGDLSLSMSEVHVWGDSDRTLIENAADLRACVRENPFRPLATARGLTGGWRVNVEGDAARLHAVVETVYPGLVAEWAANQSGTLDVLPLDATLERQTGMFRTLARLTSHDCAALVMRVCGGCVRHPTWYEGYSLREGLPCAEACNIWMSEALEIDE